MGAFFNRLMYRKGWGKAIVALGHKLVVIVYGIIRTRTPDYELGADYYDQINPERTISRLVRRLGSWGWRSRWYPRRLTPKLCKYDGVSG